MLILRTLSLRDLHGYGIVQFIQQSSDNDLLVEEGSLYPALQRLELNGWIDGVWGVTSNNRRARIYKITAAGRKQLAVETGKGGQSTPPIVCVNGSGSDGRAGRPVTGWRVPGVARCLREELQPTREEGAEEEQGWDGLSVARPVAAIWQRRPEARRITGDLDYTVLVGTWPGCPLWMPQHGRQEGLQHSSRTVAGARHRRQYYDLQPHGVDPVALAAGGRSRVPGGLELAEPAAPGRQQGVGPRHARVTGHGVAGR